MTLSTSNLDYLIGIASGEVEKKVFLHPERCLSCSKFEDLGNIYGAKHRFWCNSGERMVNVTGMEDCVDGWHDNVHE